MKLDGAKIIELTVVACAVLGVYQTAKWMERAAPEPEPLVIPEGWSQNEFPLLL